MIMTNAEKFKEVFGIEVKPEAHICDITNCDLGCPSGDTEDCDEAEDWFNAEYVEPEV